MEEAGAHAAQADVPVWDLAEMPNSFFQGVLARLGLALARPPPALTAERAAGKATGGKAEARWEAAHGPVGSAALAAPAASAAILDAFLSLDQAAQLHNTGGAKAPRKYVPIFGSALLHGRSATSAAVAAASEAQCALPKQKWRDVPTPAGDTLARPMNNGDERQEPSSPVRGTQQASASSNPRPVHEKRQVLGLWIFNITLSEASGPQAVITLCPLIRLINIFFRLSLTCPCHRFCGWRLDMYGAWRMFSYERVDPLVDLSLREIAEEYQQARPSSDEIV